MAYLIAVHSFRSGTGKTTICANLGVLLAMQGFRVGLFDVNLQSPSLPYLFGLGSNEFTYTLNDFLWGNCEITDIAYPINLGMEPASTGNLFLIPASMRIGEIARISSEGYDVGLLNDGIHHLGEQLKLDHSIIDTHAGLNEETLLSIAISTTLVIISRADAQDFQGTAIVLDTARKLEVPRTLLIGNQIPARFDFDKVRSHLERVSNCPVGAMLHMSTEFPALAGEGIFVQQYPDHPITAELKTAANLLK